MDLPGFDLPRFQEEPVVGIIRGVREESLDGVMEASVEAGLRFVEITFNTPGAAHLIEKAAAKYSLCIGAGTILTREEAERAVGAGARFLVSPTLNNEIAAFCRGCRIPYFPGALTPTEIERAWRAGATLVKVFPASQAGPKYFSEIKGPFADIPLMAVGGLNLNNLGDYLAAGASAVAFGGSIYSRQRMAGGEFSAIGRDIREFLLAVREFYSRIK